MDNKKNYSTWIQRGSGIEVVKPAKQPNTARVVRKPTQTNTKRKVQK